MSGREQNRAALLSAALPRYHEDHSPRMATHPLSPQDAKPRRTRRWPLLLGVATVAFYVCFGIAEGRFAGSVSTTFPLNDPIRGLLRGRVQSAPTGMAVAAPGGTAPASSHPAGQDTKQTATPVLPSAVTGGTLTVRLRGRDGREMAPRFHIENDTARLQIDERHFTPGFYTLAVTQTDAATGQGRTAEQEFAWGVLAMNPDKDRYRQNDVSHIAIGVLDENGAIVCDAQLLLAVTEPDGTRMQLSTTDGTIRVTGTCGRKEAGLVTPDYETDLSLPMIGEYRLELTAVRPDSVLHAVSAITSTITVVQASPFFIKRTAATRLWPFAPSTMDIDVAFTDAFTGTIGDVLPAGFTVLSSLPPATTGPFGGSDALSVQWTGMWAAGQTAHFRYVYDAPDVSPAFYLIGPLQIEAVGGAHDEERRSWQIANDNPSQSTNYTIASDVVAAGGDENARSTNYRLSDTIGEQDIGPGTGTNYALSAGYRQTTQSFIGMTCTASVSLGTIVYAGRQTGSGSCTVVTDGAGGYALSWTVLTGSGGVNTGSLIGQSNAVIRPYAPRTPGTPETWTVASTRNAWGGRLRSTSTDTDVKWGTDGTSDKWLNVGTGSYTIVQRAGRTTTGGSVEIVQLRAEVGSLVVQRPDTYQTTITYTATTP